MNENDDNPLHPAIDEITEARIVAWVLGEASAFEISELERLCAEKPEAAAFHRRMLALQGLLVEAMEGKGGDEWKLPAAKALPIHEKTEREVSEVPPVRRRLWRMSAPWIGMAACLGISAVVWRYHGREDDYGGYGALGTSKVEYRPSAGGGIAAKEDAERSEERLLRAIREQEDKVEESRKTLSNIVREKGVVFSGNESIFAFGGGVDDVDTARSAADAYSPPAQRDSNRRKEDAVKRGIDTMDYAAAKTQFEEERSILKEMKVRLGVGKAGGDAGAGIPLPLPSTAAAPAAPAEPEGMGQGMAFALPDERSGARPRIVPKPATNSASRSGLDRIELADNEYLQAANGDTRGELLMKVERAWELEVPADGAGLAFGSGLKDGSQMDGESRVPYIVQDEGTKIDPFADTGANASALVAPKKSQKEWSGFGEIPAAEEAFSTFSLSVSDVSFQLAKAALEAGAVPDAGEVKVEQFYNAVDYGDPSPPAGEPVAGVVEQSAHPVIPGRNLVRLGVKTASAGRGTGQPLRVTLLIDQSGSMIRDDRKEALAKALQGLGGLLTEEDRVSVVGFSRMATLLADSVDGKGLGKVAGLLNQDAAEAGTNLEEALKLAGRIATRQKLDGARNRIVLFTDGAANLGDADPGKLAEKVKELRQSGIALDIAGIGAEGLNDRLLAELARHGDGRYFVAAENLGELLAGAFRPAAEDVKVQVRFNPERVSRYKLIGFEENRLAKEDFRNDAVDAAELSAEEAAVALYQVELLPGGKGEIGEMSVRFRDAVTKGTVERSWTIPFDEAAPAFDKASAPMQLAGLSMLAGEKLKGGPLADAIDFRKFAGPVAVAKEYYKDSRKAADMFRVIGLLSK